MNRQEMEVHLQEARLQEKALKRIGRWRTYMLALSAVGIAVSYFSFTATEKPLGYFIGAMGILMIIGGILLSWCMNIAIRNGRNNVEKILNALEHGTPIKGLYSCNGYPEAR
ncbi:MAG: hypothetical protein IIU28_07425 [Lachnospiraceae bacterium]|nr:hypothetical protein [Lachnospiraceae bacterium]